MLYNLIEAPLAAVLAHLHHDPELQRRDAHLVYLPRGVIEIVVDLRLRVPVRPRAVRLAANHRVVAEAVDLRFAQMPVFAVRRRLGVVVLQAPPRSREVELVERREVEVPAPEFREEPLPLAVPFSVLPAAQVVAVLLPEPEVKIVEDEQRHAARGLAAVPVYAVKALGRALRNGASNELPAGDNRRVEAAGSRRVPLVEEAPVQVDLVEVAVGELLDERCVALRATSVSKVLLHEVQEHVEQVVLPLPRGEGDLEHREQVREALLRALVIAQVLCVVLLTELYLPFLQLPGVAVHGIVLHRMVDDEVVEQEPGLQQRVCKGLDGVGVEPRVGELVYQFLVVEVECRRVEPLLRHPRDLQHDEQEVGEIDDWQEVLALAAGIAGAVLPVKVARCQHLPDGRGPHAVAPFVGPYEAGERLWLQVAQALAEHLLLDLPGVPLDVYEAGERLWLQVAQALAENLLLDLPGVPLDVDRHLAAGFPDPVERRLIAVRELLHELCLDDLVLLELLTARVHDLEVVVEVDVLRHAVVDDVDASQEVIFEARQVSFWDDAVDGCPGELVAALYRQVDLFDVQVIKVPQGVVGLPARPVGEPARHVAAQRREDEGDGREPLLAVDYLVRPVAAVVGYERADVVRRLAPAEGVVDVLDEGIDFVLAPGVVPLVDGDLVRALFPESEQAPDGGLVEGEVMSRHRCPFQKFLARKKWR